MSRSHRPLGAALEPPLVVLVHEGKGPVARGSASDGFDYTCHACDLVLAESVDENALWDVGLKCPQCGALNDAPSLSADRPLPRQFVEIMPGVRVYRETIDLRGASVVGTPGLARRGATRPTREATFRATETAYSLVIEPREFLSDLVDRVRATLGDAFAVIEARDKRRRASRAAPENRHGLMVAVEAVQASIVSLESFEPTIAVSAVTELDVVLRFLERWRGVREWPTLIEALSQQQQYAHTVVLLATATALADKGNVVDFMPTARSRTPDLVMMRAAGGWFAVEVKGPRALATRFPRRWKADEAYDLIRTQVMRARRGNKGQMAAGEAGLLVIGGMYNHLETIECLKAAAVEYLADAAGKHRHSDMEGISLVNVATLVENRAPLGRPLLPFAQFRWVRHPGYRGRASIVPSNAGMNVVSGPLTQPGDVRMDV